VSWLSNATTHRAVAVTWSREKIAVVFWWVNHKQTRNYEIRGGYLWSPMRNANGASNQTYENMARARLGDVVFSYANGRLGSI
jgi:putative restriction endonuclease